MHFFVVSLALLALISSAYAHSWVQCTDYAEENAKTWDASKCRAWPRNYANIFQYTSPPYLFGGDMGYDYKPGEACKSRPSQGDYTQAYPQAKYGRGQKVCVAWPAKNHVAANCGSAYNNPNIKDAGTKILRSDVNPTSDPTLAQFQANVVQDFGAAIGITGNGFQNCPEFCADRDKCICTGCFTVPTDLALGTYTFMWYWAFNGPTDIYTSCWEATIVDTPQNTVTTLPKSIPGQTSGTNPTSAPSNPTAAPSNPTAAPSNPTAAPSNPTAAPSNPTAAPSNPTAAPSNPGSCNVGAKNCACTGGGACDPGLTCLNSVCISPICNIGAIRCSCTSGGACDSGLTCSSNVCVNSTEANAIKTNESPSSVSTSLILPLLYVFGSFVLLEYLL